MCFCCQQACSIAYVPEATLYSAQHSLSTEVPGCLACLSAAFTAWASTSTLHMLLTCMTQAVLCARTVAFTSGSDKSDARLRWLSHMLPR